MTTNETGGYLNQIVFDMRREEILLVIRVTPPSIAEAPRTE